MKLIKCEDFEFIDHGIEHSQYFQGYGTTFSEWEYAATGVGDNPKEAIEDALEELSNTSWDTEDLEQRLKEQIGEFPINPSVHELNISEDSELYYFISIRIK